MIAHFHGAHFPVFPRPLASYWRVFSVVQGVIFLGAESEACSAMHNSWLAWHTWCTRQGETEVLDPILCHVLRIRQVRVALCRLCRIMTRD